MNTTIANTDVYLNLLASRAITGLVHLARDPLMWNNNIETDLGGGVTFCEVLDDEQQGATLQQHEDKTYAKLLNHLTSNLPTSRPGIYVSGDEVRQTKNYLRGLVAREITPTPAELLESMKFFLKATSGHSARTKPDDELF